MNPVIYIHNQMNNIHNLDLNLLKLLHHVLTTRHLVKAAEQLHVTQSAVSHALKKLRLFFDDELLVRVGNSMQLTPLAISLKPKVTRIMKLIEEDLLNSETFDPTISNKTFTLRSSEHFDVVFLPNLLQFMQQNAPNCRLTVLPIEAGKLTECLDAAEADIAIDVDRKPAGELHSEQLTTMNFVSCVCQTHPLATKNKPNIHDFLNFEHALISTNNSGLGAVDSALQAQNKQRQIRLRIGKFAMAPQAILNTDMILTGPDRFLKQQAKLLPIHCFDTPISLPNFPISMLWHKRDDNDSANQWLRKAIRTIMT